MKLDDIFFNVLNVCQLVNKFKIITWWPSQRFRFKTFSWKKHFRRLASNFNYDLRFFMHNLLQTSYAFVWLYWNHFPESSVIVKCGPDKANMRKIWSEIFNAVWYDLNYKPKTFVLDYSISLTKSALLMKYESYWRKEYRISGNFGDDYILYHFL